MDPKELRGLLEAYSEVYAPVEELYKGKHGQSETEYMDSRSDAGKQISGTSKLSGAAYSHRSFKGVGKPAKPGERQQNQGKMTPADRTELAYRKANLKKEDVEIDEAVKGESSERRKDLAAERRAGHRPLSKKEGENYASHKLAQMAYAKRKRMGEEVEEVEEAMTSYEKNRQRAAQRAAARNAARDAGQTGAVKGVGYVSSRRERETWTDEGGRERHKTGARMPQKEEVEQIDEISTRLAGNVVNARIERTGAAASREMKNRTPQNVRDTVAAADKEAKARKLAAGVRARRAANEEVDIFDTVLEFLQAEGFAETLEEAEWIMANQLDSEDIAAIVESMHEDDEEEMKKGKKSKKSEEDEEDEEDDDDDLKEASYSAKAARVGKDIGKPGKQFEKIAKSAAKRYGSKESGEKVAGAVLAKLRAKKS